MQITIDDKVFDVKPSDTILDVARREGIKIPTLCFDPDLNPKARCRLCICDVNGKIQTACNTKVSDKMIVKTKTEEIIKLRKINLELLLTKYDFRKGPSSTLKSYLSEYGIDLKRFKNKNIKKNEIDTSNNCIAKDLDLCILCGQCIDKCHSTQSVDAICFLNRGKEMIMDNPLNSNMANSTCVSCGACTLVCPTRALREVDDTKKVKEALKDKDKFVIFQIAPSVRVTIGEEFGLKPGMIVKNQLVAAMKKIGAYKVFDTNFSADLTIMEEGSELIKRLTSNSDLPLITSCSPGWVNYIEKFYPNLINHLSSCKSPQQMMGAIIKTYYAEKVKIDPSKIFVVSIMPCTAKKAECKREGMYSSGFQDVDISLTTRETARLIKDYNIDLKDIDGDEFDNPLGESTGAAVIFGATGGVLEAALRTGYEIVTSKTLTNLNFYDTRGLNGLKEGSIDLEGKKLNFAVANGLSNAKILLEEINKGISKYHFIEIMACLGGCLGGGGQPIPTTNEIRKLRMEGIYKEDKDLPIRKSHENPYVKKLYEEFLIEPLSEKSHELLHTTYKSKETFL